MTLVGLTHEQQKRKAYKAKDHVVDEYSQTYRRLDGVLRLDEGVWYRHYGSFVSSPISIVLVWFIKTGATGKQVDIYIVSLYLVLLSLET